MKMKDVYPYHNKLGLNLQGNSISFENDNGKELISNAHLRNDKTPTGFNITADLAYQVESTGVLQPVVHKIEQIPILTKRVISTVIEPKLTEDICNL